MLQPPGSGTSGHRRATHASRRKAPETPDDTIRQLQRLPPNKKCADCSSKLPSCVNLTVGSFVCITCAGVHRELNARVKGVGHSSFTAEEAEQMKATDNDKINAVYMARYNPRSERLRQPLDNRDAQLLRTWIRRKYQDKAWYQPNGAAADPQATVVQIPPKQQQQPQVDLFGGDFTPAPAPVQQQQSGGGWDAFGSSQNQQQQQQVQQGGGWDAFGGSAQNQQQQQRAAPPAPQAQAAFNANFPSAPPQQQQAAFPADFGSSQTRHQHQQTPPRQTQPTPAFQANFGGGQVSSASPQQQQQPNAFGSQPQVQQQAAQPGGFANFGGSPAPSQGQAGGFANFGGAAPPPQAHQHGGAPPHQQASHPQTGNFANFGGPAQAQVQTAQLGNSFGSPHAQAAQQQAQTAQQQPGGFTNFGVPPLSPRQATPQAAQPGGYGGFGGPPSPQQAQAFQQVHAQAFQQVQAQQASQQVQAQQASQQVQAQAPQQQPSGYNNFAQQMPPSGMQSQQHPLQVPSLQQQPPNMMQSQNVVMAQHQQSGTVQPPGSVSAAASAISSMNFAETTAKDASTPASAPSNSSQANSKPKTNQRPSKYKAGQHVFYKSQSYVGNAEIVKVHLDDDLEPFYTISVNGKEKQTDDAHLSAKSPLQEEIEAALLSLSEEQLKQVKDFVSGLKGGVASKTSEAPPVSTRATPSPVPVSSTPSANTSIHSQPASANTSIHSQPAPSLPQSTIPQDPQRGGHAGAATTTSHAPPAPASNSFVGIPSPPSNTGPPVQDPRNAVPGPPLAENPTTPSSMPRQQQLQPPQQQQLQQQQQQQYMQQPAQFQNQQPGMQMANGHFQSQQPAVQMANGHPAPLPVDKPQFQNQPQMSPANGHPPAPHGDTPLSPKGNPFDFY